MVMTAVIVVTGVAAGLIGYGVGVSVDTRRALRQLGFTKGSAKLYRRAFALLNRMSRVIELDGDFAGDILSPATRKQVDDLLDDYRKELETQ